MLGNVKFGIKMTLTNNKSEQHNLINNCMEPFQKTLTNSYEKTLAKVLKDLFAKAQNAHSNLQESQLFEQYDSVKKHHSNSLASLASIIKSMPTEITNQQDTTSEELVELSLVEEEELETTLSFSQMESVLDIKFSKYLVALEKRLKLLLASNTLTKFNMPFGITSICWVFSQALSISKFEKNAKSTILEELKSQLSNDLLAFYKIANDKFVQAGILPNLMIEEKSVLWKKGNKFSSGLEAAANYTPEKKDTYKSPKKDEGNKTDSNQQNQKPPESIASNEKLNKLIDSIFTLMSNNRPQALHISKDSFIDNNLLDKTLENLSKVTSIGAGSFEIERLKEMVLDDVSENTGINYPTLSLEQQNTLDIMAMFYEQVKSDISIDNSMASSLNAINLPLIRTAVNDETFFENSNHPARKYLEKIIYASQKWHGTPVVKKIHKFSTHVADEFDGSQRSFERANEDLESFLRLTERRARKAESKWIKTAKGKEKLEISRHKVDEIMNNVVDNAHPKFVKNVLKSVLKDAMTLSLLRHGEESKEWYENINATSTIAKMSNPDLVNELSAKQKVESLHHLDKTMDELGFSKIDRTKTLNNIKECTQAAINKTPEAEIPLEKVTSISKSTKPINKQGTKKIEEIRELTNKEKAELSKFKLVPYGTFFDFVMNQQRDKVRRKLSWFSPLSNRALFVSVLGNKPHEMSMNLIAIDIARKAIIQIDVQKTQYFEKTLKNIFAKLKGMMTKPKATQS